MCVVGYFLLHWFRGTVATHAILLLKYDISVSISSSLKKYSAPTVDFVSGVVDSIARLS